MEEKKKLGLTIAFVVLAVIAAGLVGYKALAPPHEEIVGTLDPPGGGATGMRDGQPAPKQVPGAPPVNVEGGKGGE